MDLVGDGDQQYQIDARLTLTNAMYMLEEEREDLNDSYIQTRDDIEESLAAINDSGNV